MNLDEKINVDSHWIHPSVSRDINFRVEDCLQVRNTCSSIRTSVKDVTYMQYQGCTGTTAGGTDALACA